MNAQHQHSQDHHSARSTPNSLLPTHSCRKRDSNVHVDLNWNTELEDTATSNWIVHNGRVKFVQELHLRTLHRDPQATAEPPQLSALSRLVVEQQQMSSTCPRIASVGTCRSSRVPSLRTVGSLGPAPFRTHAVHAGLRVLPFVAVRTQSLWDASPGVMSQPPWSLGRFSGRRPRARSAIARAR